jgi:hypothetical protein
LKRETKIIIIKYRTPPPPFKNLKPAAILVLA